MSRRKFTILLTLVTSLALVVTSTLVFLGGFDVAQVHRINYPIQFNNETAILSIKLQSEKGVFSTGNIINVKPILWYPTKGQENDPVRFFIQFPDSMSPKEYEKLVKIQDDLKINQTKNFVEYQFPSITYYALFGGPLANEFEVVWTQQGSKNGILFVDPKNGTNPLEISLDNVINIQSMDVNLQLENTKITLGLSLLVTALTLMGLIPIMDALLSEKKTSLQKHENIKDIKNVTNTKSVVNTNTDISIINDNEHNFENDIIKYSFDRMKAETTEIQRIKDRATTLFGFCLVILTGFSAIALFYLQNDNVFHLNPYLPLGFGFLFVTMGMLFFVMIASTRRHFLDPERFFRIYDNQNYGIAKGVLRETLFFAIREMDSRNSKFSILTNITYILFPIGPAIMFIPFLMSLLS